MRQLWLEKIGYAHGGLRLDNILIDVNKDIKIADFDATVEIGSELLAGALPWAKEDAQGNCPQAGPETEQFSLGSCMFNIRYGHPPYAELESPVWYEYMSHQRYPPTPKGDDIGDIIQACWRGDYASIEQLEDHISLVLGIVPRKSMSPWMVVSHSVRFWCLRVESHAWLAGQRLQACPTLGNRLRLWRWWLVNSFCTVFQ